VTDIVAAPLPVRVLFIEDTPDDAELIVRTMRSGGFDVSWTRVEEADGLRAALDRESWDVILCDFSMARFRPAEALAELQRRNLDIPLLVVSGAIDEQTAVALMRAGARDYVLKDNLARLVPAITRELRGALARHEGREVRKAFRRSESFFRAVVEHSSDLIAVIGTGGRILHIAPSVTRILGPDPEALIGTPFLDLVVDADRESASKALDELRESGQRVVCEGRFRRADGSTRLLECVGSRFRTPADGDALAINGRDVTERRRYERSLRDTSARLSLVNAVARAARIGATSDQIVRRTLEHLASAFPGMAAAYSEIDANDFLIVRDVAGPRELLGPQGRSIDLSLVPDVCRTLQQGRVFAVSDVDSDARVEPIEDAARSMRVTASAVAPLMDLGRVKGGLSLVAGGPHDWTSSELAVLGEVAVHLSLALNEVAAQRERRLAEDALQESEAKLRQAQKMEAIGRLAGGVAHDFNNLLTAILGYGEIVSEEIGDAHPARNDLEQILDAARRAATLTRQLLAFSRQQMLAPEVLRANDVIADMAQLLGRLIGQDIELQLDLQRDAGCITVDRGQLEQVLMNLAVNARDAMPEGGRLRIATRSVELDRDAAGAIQVVPGRHVLIEVGDTGIGMDRETAARIFEPFFTTKQEGEGTGLGLATVYGIVSQSGGGVEVDSEPGRGATFRLYFPETDHAGTELGSIRRALIPRLVLLLEPDETTRMSARRILARAGHTLLEASAVDTALALGERNPVDVLLVGAGAREPVDALADALRLRLPALQVATLPPYPFSPATLLERLEPEGTPKR